MLSQKNNPSTAPGDNTSTTENTAVCAIQPGVSLQAGIICPRCGQGVLDYDGTLNLICPVCGVVEGGCFT